MFEVYTIRGTIRLGKAFGVPVRVHYTWLLAVILITVTLVITLSGVYPMWQDIIIGIVASLLFFVSIIVLALAQGAVAKSLGVPLKSITLYIFGSVPRISDRDTRPVPEVLMALAGPVASLVIAGLFLMGNYIFAGFEHFRTAELLNWVAYFNIMIAIFNIIPGFPLDFGRILRTVIWITANDYRKATRAAVTTGWIIGLILILGGATLLILTAVGLAIILGGWLTGLWIAFLGWFLQNAASTSRRQAQLRDILHGAPARYMMNENYTPIRQQLTVRAAREYIKNSGQDYFVVLEDGALLGIVALNDVRIPQKRWDDTTIKEVMTPVSRLKTTNPGQPVADILEQMEDYDIKQIPVMEEGKLLGVVSRYDLLRFLRTRAKLEE